MTFIYIAAILSRFPFNCACYCTDAALPGYTAYCLIRLWTWLPIYSLLCRNQINFLAKTDFRLPWISFYTASPVIPSVMDNTTSVTVRVGKNATEEL